MVYFHEDYFTYELPNGWCSEEDGESLLIYNPSGDGAITISFFSVLDMDKTLDEHISIMAKKFIEKNKISLRGPFILCGSKESKITLYGTGTSFDNWFIKIWVVARYPKIAFATYQSERKTSEIKIRGFLKYLQIQNFVQDEKQNFQTLWKISNPIHPQNWYSNSCRSFCHKE